MELQTMMEEVVYKMFKSNSLRQPRITFREEGPAMADKNKASP